MNSDLKLGDIVMNPKAPDWGPGKVLEQSETRVTVYFRDVAERPVRVIDPGIVSLELSAEESDTLLDNLPPYNTDTRQRFEKRVTLADGLDKFRHYFPKLFDDPAYLVSDRSGERGYKMQAHELFQNLFGNGQARELLDSDLDEVRQRLFQVENLLNLLSPYEKMALKDGLKSDEAAREFFSALFDVIDSPDVDEKTYSSLISAVKNLPQEQGKARVATWPVLTQFPYIARPDCHMFLKPEVTNSCAARMAFDLNYTPELNWRTYRQLLVLSDRLFEFLEPLGARDYIDVQSFIWAVGYYD